MTYNQLTMNDNIKTSHTHSFDPNEALSEGLRLHQSGQLEHAAKIYKEIIENDPKHSDALHLLGFMSHQTGENRKAEQLICRAIQHHPETPFFHNSLGIVYESQGLYDKAMKCYQDALNLKPGMIEALNNMGLALMKADRPDKSIQFFENALKIDPDNPEILINLAEVCTMLKKFDDAIHLYERVIQLVPNDVQACFGLGCVFQTLGKPAHALQYYSRVLEIEPEHTEALLNKGVSHHELDQISEAIVCYQKVVKTDPSCIKAYDNLGKAFQDLGDLEKALHYYEKTLKQEPENADTRFDRSLILLLMGNLIQGFREYEWRFLQSNWNKTYPHRFVAPRWDGARFKGKQLLVHSEQGLGDTIQFIRYLPMVKALGGKVFFETQKPFLNLFKNFSGVDQLIPASSTQKPDLEFDDYIPLLSLPAVFKTTLETIPSHIPYLFADPQKAVLWGKQVHETGFNIGLVWAGSPTNHDDRNRSIPLHRFAPLWSVTGVRFYGLQKGTAADQVNDLPEMMDIVNLGEGLEDFADTAGLIENLDLIISVDTATTHLAGAMGKPVWTLLPFTPDWRWLRHREDTPWYPTMRLFRQPKYGDWESVIKDVCLALEKQLQDKKIKIRVRRARL